MRVGEFVRARVLVCVGVYVCVCVRVCASTSVHQAVLYKTCKMCRSKKEHSRKKLPMPLNVTKHRVVTNQKKLIADSRAI